jgi:hypothetical protein
VASGSRNVGLRSIRYMRNQATLGGSSIQPLMLAACVGRTGTRAVKSSLEANPSEQRTFPRAFPRLLTLVLPF